MPTISRFYGIVIQMFWNDHAPPHFHALYGDDEAVIGLEGLTVLRGHLPGRAMNLVIEWASQHRAELEEDWEFADLVKCRTESTRWPRGKRSEILCALAGRECARLA